MFSKFKTHFKTGLSAIFKFERSELSEFLKSGFACALIVALISLLQYISLDVSANVTTSVFMGRRLVNHLCCCGCALFVTSLLVLFTGRISLSCMISSVFFALLGVVNYYVTLYYGEPLSLLTLVQFRTAMNVEHGYTFTLDRAVVVILGFFVLNIGLSIILKEFCERKVLLRRKKLLRLAGLCCALAMMVGAGFVIRRKVRFGYLFNYSVILNRSGYLGWAISNSYFSFQSSLREPLGYSEESVRKIMPSAYTGQYPDIILILNESLYELKQYTDYKTDVPYFKNWNSAKNAYRGYAVCPYMFGGTNDTEAELLTSHPAYLMSRRAPMNWMNMSKVNSIARYLDALGYQTWAMHPMDGMNYKRDTAWPALGFQNTRFQDDFTEHEVYGKRIETDASNYRDMIRWYESAGEEPRFFYLLTYQNHGGYRQNPAALDTVHIKTKYSKDRTNMLNEYLTCMRMSDEAIGDLLKYFEGVQRPVIVCVLGDHAPYFAQVLRKKADKKAPAGLAARKVPLLVWANSAFGPLSARWSHIVSMTDIMPLILKAARMPLSPYYEYLCDLAQDIPIRDRDGSYFVAGTWKKGKFAAGDRNYERLLPYYSAAYADYAGSSEKLLPEIFQPPKKTDAAK